jgi:hypothetical protein
MPWYEALPAFFGVAFLGWLAGMATFKRSLRWCGTCGRRLTCTSCDHMAAWAGHQRTSCSLTRPPHR